MPGLSKEPDLTQSNRALSPSLGTLFALRFCESTQRHFEGHCNVERAVRRALRTNGRRWRTKLGRNQPNAALESRGRAFPLRSMNEQSRWYDGGEGGRAKGRGRGERERVRDWRLLGSVRGVRSNVIDPFHFP